MPSAAIAPGAGHADATDPGADDPGPSPKPDPTRAPDVTIDDPGAALTQDRRDWLIGRSRDALRALGVREGELRLRLAGDAEMAEAHERHRDAPGTTDVITFDLADGAAAGGAPLDADLLLGADVARAAARERDIPVERELLLYAVHGALHCLGHDDADPERARVMHEREDEILRAIGVGATYAPGPDRPGPADASRRRQAR